jgi:uncharacterized protein
MAQATDQQMQQYSDQRIRIRAEQWRAMVNACRDDKAAIDAAYDRAANGSAWSDARTDGPPRLLGSQDVLVFNALISNFNSLITGSGENDAAKAAIVNGIRDNLAVFQSSCVRPV